MTAVSRVMVNVPSSPVGVYAEDLSAGRLLRGVIGTGESSPHQVAAAVRVVS